MQSYLLKPQETVVTYTPFALGKFSTVTPGGSDKPLVPEPELVRSKITYWHRLFNSAPILFNERPCKRFAIYFEMEAMRMIIAELPKSSTTLKEFILDSFLLNSEMER